MSETITETILPGTYIDVRAEGLIGVGGIATGNVGIVGTAQRGPLGQVVTLGSYSEVLDTFGAADRWPDTANAQAAALTLTRACQQLFAGGASTVLAVRIDGAGMDAAEWSIPDAAGGNNPATLVTLTATSKGTWANSVVVTVTDVQGEPSTITLTRGREKETFSGAGVGELAAAINATSRMVTAGAVAAGDVAKRPRAGTVAASKAGAGNGNPATATTIGDALALLEGQTVNIVVVAGEGPATASAPLLAHLEATENAAHERIGVLGASAGDANTVNSEATSLRNGRLVFVAPAIRADDPARAGEKTTVVTLPPPYTAALIAGKMAALAPHISLTNKDLPVAGLVPEYTRAQLKGLVNSRVLAVKKDLGFRIVKGISTDDGPFKQVSVRRIVDFAKEGVRRGSNPYIGRLNNSRVRAALKATLDGFLSGMVLDEMLTGYTLSVTATRSQEINGEAIVTMTLQPTFSIDVIKVIMNLQ